MSCQTVRIAAVLSVLFASISGAFAVPESRAELAQDLLDSSRISVLNYHVSGRRDSATARDNLLQTAAGQSARRSYYGRGPGGRTQLDSRMLYALRTLAAEGYTFRITELAGGSHSSRSRHYAGLAFDIDMLNGRKVGRGNPSMQRFLRRCRQLGATEVFGPGSPGHATHLHVAWPRVD